MTSTATLLASGAEFYAAGRFAEAALQFRAAAEASPDDAIAWVNLGEASRAAGDLDAALAALAIAAERDPGLHLIPYNRGIVHAQRGEARAAMDCYVQALVRDPTQVAVWENLGASLLEAGDPGGAEACYRRALTAGETWVRWYNLGHALARRRALDPAREALLRAVHLSPVPTDAAHRGAEVLRVCFGSAHALIFLADSGLDLAGQVDLAVLQVSLLHEARRRPEAWAAAEAASARFPEEARLVRISAAIAADMGDSDALERVLARPAAAGVAREPYLAGLMAAQQRYAEAADHHEATLAGQESDSAFWHNLGIFRQTAGEIAAARAAFERAVALAPHDPRHHNDLGITLLLAGDWARGWAEHEWRLKLPVHGGAPDPRLRFWQGEPVAGKRILVLGEQGLGDVIQFARFARLLRDQGARVDFIGARPLTRLLIAAGVVDHAISPPEVSDRPDFAVWIMSLAHRFGVTPDTVPLAHGYLAVDPSPRPADSRRRIGLAWRGNPSNIARRGGNIDLADLARVVAQPEIAFFLLHPDVTEAELATLAPGPGSTVENAGAGFTDLLDTARLVVGLDLVITIDSMAAHLAGALGVPVWVTLPLAPDYRWGITGETTPWYRSARLFRRTIPDEPMADRLIAALGDFTRA